MYRHLLVPLDDSPLSAETVRKAVELARALAAKITFFHAQEDYESSSVGALQRVIAPAAYNDSAAGEGRAILAKAEVVAREARVPFESVTVTSNRPYEAILDAAEARGCDLVFMSSHGRRGLKGLTLGSQTHKVLLHTAIPVLVSAVESNLPEGAMIEPLTILGDEHRSLAAVIQGLEFLVRQARESGKPPPFPLLRAIVHYIQAFPERLHHPKEESYLFRKLAERTGEYDAALEELRRQHEDGRERVAELEVAIDAYERDAREFPGFAAAASRFAASQMEHMTFEAKVILPAAREHLTEDDWAAIAEAFAGNGDPRFSIDNDEEYRQLFARILNLAPADVIGGATQAGD